MEQAFEVREVVWPVRTLNSDFRRCVQGLEQAGGTGMGGEGRSKRVLCSDHRGSKPERNEERGLEENGTEQTSVWLRDRGKKCKLLEGVKDETRREDKITDLLTARNVW